jgi:prepilin signal peptidase PulO-like enzyme (type II secretory pathway)
LVELTTAVLFLLLWHAFSYQPFLLILQMIFFSLLVVILVYDLRHFIIPDEAVLGLLLCACVMRAYGLVVLDQTYGVLADDILAALAASGFFAALWLVSRGRWMGLGDAKLTLPLALIAGVEATLSTVILAFWIGAAASVCVMGLQRLLFAAGTTRLPYAASPLRMKSEVPFAPFLIVGFVCAYLLHVDVLAIVFSFTG